MYYKSLTFLLCSIMCFQTYAASIKVTSSTGKSTNAKINIGAFLENDCRNELKQFKAQDSLTLKWELQADSNDLQQEVDLISVVEVASFFFYQDADGVFTLWEEGDYDSLEGFKTVTLTSRTIFDTIISDLVPGDVGLAGLDYGVYTGYRKKDGEVIFNDKPYKFSVSAEGDGEKTPITDFWPCSLKQGSININSFLSSDPEKNQRNDFTTGDNVTFTAEITPDSSELSRTGFVYLFVKDNKDGKSYIYNDEWKPFDSDNFQPTAEVTLSSSTSLQLFVTELEGLESEYEFHVGYSTLANTSLQNIKMSEIYRINVAEGEPTLPPNTAPSIIKVPSNQTIDANTSTQELAISVDDLETAVDDLVLTASSDNETLIDTAGIVLGGSESSRTVKLTPKADQSGTATITLTIDDGSLSSQTTFNLAVTAVPPEPANTLPTVIAPADQVINENNATGALTVTVGDAETPAGSLVLTATSNNTALIDNTDMVLAGTGTSRTITLTPKTNQWGSAIITLTIDDGSLSSQATFDLDVNQGNTAPTVTPPTDQIISQDTTTGPLTVTIGDAETAADSLVLTASSDNTTLIDSSGMVLNGTGTSRTITLTPNAFEAGAATITLSIYDGSVTTQATFNLLVNSSSGGGPLCDPSDPDFPFCLD